MSASWVRAAVGLIAFAVVLVIGINVAGAIDLTPDATTGVPVGFNTVVTEAPPIRRGRDFPAAPWMKRFAAAVVIAEVTE